MKIDNFKLLKPEQRGTYSPLEFILLLMSHF